MAAAAAHPLHLIAHHMSHCVHMRVPMCHSCRSEENAGVLEGTAVELLRAMVEEADDLPQSQLDILLTRLLPAHAAEAPASHAATKALLQRTETTVQPYLQRLLSGLLTGARSDSELRGDYHSVFYAVGSPAHYG